MATKQTHFPVRELKKTDRQADDREKEQEDDKERARERDGEMNIILIPSSSCLRPDNKKKVSEVCDKMATYAVFCLVKSHL